jgi:hypothetical protein
VGRDRGGDAWAFVVPLLPINLRKVFEVGILSPDFGVSMSEKSYKVGLVAAKYS